MHTNRYRGLPLRYSLSALLLAVTIALSLLARHVSKLNVLKNSVLNKIVGAILCPFTGKRLCDYKKSFFIPFI